MGEIEQLYTLYKLKNVSRRGTVDGTRFESTAEHIYSTLFLALHFLPKIEQQLDESKIIRMILVHDLVEIYAGDTFILDEDHHLTKNDRELHAYEKLKKTLPQTHESEYLPLWEEFEAQQTLEAKYVKAIEEIDPMMQSIQRPQEWIKNGFSEEKLRVKKEKSFKEFPILQEFFETLIKHLHKTGAI